MSARAVSATLSPVELASEIANELVDALWRHAGAAVRASILENGTPERKAAEAELDQLDEELSNLEAALHERIYPEAS